MFYNDLSFPASSVYPFASEQTLGEETKIDKSEAEKIGEPLTDTIVTPISEQKKQTGILLTVFGIIIAIVLWNIGIGGE